MLAALYGQSRILLRMAMLVAVAVLVLRRARLDLEQGFRVPGGPIIPLAAIVADVLLTLLIPFSSLVRLAAWMALGVGVYLAYGRGRAMRTLAGREAAPAPAAPAP